VFDKVEEEVRELRGALEAGEAEHAREELGDLLFSVTQLARHLEADPEAALRAANAKFERRFRCMERMLAGQGRRPRDAAPEELEALWTAAKREVG
jgi:ATP diphosphatase